MATPNTIDSFKNVNSVADLMQQAFSNKAPVEVPESPVVNTAVEIPEPADNMDIQEESAAMQAFNSLDMSEPSSEPSQTNTVNSDSTTNTGDIEELTVKGAEGRQEKLRIDYANKKAIKDAFLKAAGMRKFQAERDAETKKRLDIQKEHEGLKADFSKLEEVFSKQGVKGLASLLGGGDKAWQEAVDAEMQNRQYLANLSPDEKYKLEIAQLNEKNQAALSSERAKREKFENEIKERESQAEIRSLESKLHPSFDRYRFSGKLNDPVTEHRLDKAIWNEVTNNLAEYDEKVELTQAIIDKEFRTVANDFRKVITAQTEQNVKKTIDKKKEEAVSKAQLAAKKGLSGDNGNRKILESLKTGNLGDAVAQWMAGKK